MLLVDTNVWLASLLAQERAAEADRFLTGIDTETLAITDFAIHSVAIILIHLRRRDLLTSFLTDLLSPPGVAVLTVDVADLAEAGDLNANFGLDFDDAYQYLAARNHGCTLVTFDADFEGTDLPHTTPAQATE